MKKSNHLDYNIKTTTTSAKMAAIEIMEIMEIIRPPFVPKDITSTIDFIFKEDEIPNVLKNISDYCGEVKETDLRDIIPHYFDRLRLDENLIRPSIYKLDDIKLFSGNNIIEDWRLNEEICSKKYYIFSNYYRVLDLDKTKYNIKLELMHFSKTQSEKLKIHINFLDEISERIVDDIEFETEPRRCGSDDKFKFIQTYKGDFNKLLYHLYEKIIKRYDDCD